MPDKLDKIAQLTKNLNLPIKGLVKLKDTINIDDYDVVVQSKNEQKSYKINSSLLGSSGGGAILFPNGIEDVLVSRDFLHTDIGKALRLANDDVFLTMPEGVFWTEEEKGQVIIVIADAVNVGYDKTFELPVLMQGRDEANSLVGEYALLVTGETGGQSNVATISSAVLKDGDDWKTAIRYLYDKSGKLFPNGVNIITADYELQSSDEGKFIIAIGDNIAITIPTGIIFQGGYALGISMHGIDCTFQTDQFRGAVGFVGQVGDGLELGGESILFLTLSDDGNGNSILVPLSTSLISDGGTQKTMLRYLYDKSQNAIPLSGTVSGSPVTGDIEIGTSIGGDTKKIYQTQGVGELALQFNNDEHFISLYNSEASTGEETYLKMDNNYLLFYTDNASSRGIVGFQDYTPNITDLDYPQKIYVDKVSGFKGTFSEPSAVAQTTFTVTIPTQADTTYVVMTEATNLLSAPIRYITNKTTTSFDVVYVSGLTGAVEFDYFVKR